MAIFWVNLGYLINARVCSSAYEPVHPHVLHAQAIGVCHSQSPVVTGPIPLDAVVLDVLS